MTAAKTLLLFLAFAGTVDAQQLSHPVMLSRDDAFLSPRPALMQPDTTKVLAVMVQFQSDNDSRTSGDGRFDLSIVPTNTIDPPPRNKSYFEDHLLFLENYYRKSSKGLVAINATVIDSVFTLPAMMASYSPPRGELDSAVANLARDTWQLVNASGIVSDFSLYDCFVVFHAGVGRDVDLSSSLGFDPTPFDIPSLFIGLDAFRKFYDQPYQGIPVNGGFITNSIILPETENRLIPGIGGDVLLELGTNGLLCASVGSYLGLPDLFNTSNGRTAIGRFGLMDGQSIFSFSGLFPPEPSAWEKYYLGWVTPQEITARDSVITVPAVGLSTPSAIFHIPISGSEYYLVENRNRDPQGNGQRVTTRSSGAQIEYIFQKDTSGFNAFDISALSGNIIDVEDLDWSLPGGVGTNGEFFDGGVLIWHIDESIIASNFATNTVNANPDRRGVDLEEADGSQDIGQEYGFLSPGSGSEDGTPIDFWYANNESPVFRNAFNASSHPNSLSNNLANSHISISEFSSRGSVMTARVNVGDAQVEFLKGFPKRLGEKLTFPSAMTDGNARILVSTTGESLPMLGSQASPPSSFVAGKLYAWNSTGEVSVPGSAESGLFAQTHSQSVGRAPLSQRPAIADVNRNGVLDVVVNLGQQDVFGNSQGGVMAFPFEVTPPDSFAQPLFTTVTNRAITTSPVITDSFIVIGTDAGYLYALRGDGSIRDSFLVSSSSIRGVSLLPGSQILATSADGTVTVLSSGPGLSRIVSRNVGSEIIGPAASAVFQNGGAVMSAFVVRDGRLFLVDGMLNGIPGFPVTVTGEVLSPPGIGDVNRDGSSDIVVFSGSRINVYNSTGASLDNFPMTLVSPSPLTSTPVIADLDADGDPDIVGATWNGLVVAYNKNGKQPTGFPLQAGGGLQSIAVFEVPTLALSATGIGLVVSSSDDGTVSGWITGTVFGPRSFAKPWPQYQHDAANTGLDTLPPAGNSLSADFFPSNRAYNWPNPVYDGRTYIRYYVSEDAAVSIKIYDLVGDLVDELSTHGTGGLDNEIVWTTGNVESGVYFARIEAQGAGKNGIAIIKVAVVK